MAELELVRARAESLQPHELMSQTDAEHGHLARQAADQFRAAGDGRRIARAIRQKHAVRALGKHFFRGRRRRHDGDVRAGVAQAAQNVGLHAVIDAHDAEFGCGVLRLAAGRALVKSPRKPSLQS